MWIETPVFREDMEQIVRSDFIHWERLEGRTVFITGVTGLIGYYLASSLIYRNLIQGGRDIHILALVRDIKKAYDMYHEQLKVAGNNLQFIEGDLEAIPNINEKIDYIIHGGGPTASRFFVENPVETIKSMGNGSLQVLEIGRKKNISGMVYLSSMEVYGGHQTEVAIRENEKQLVDACNLRDCYPISKCFVENACLAYFREYCLPVNTVRLSQVIGTIGATTADKRIIAEIADCIRQGRDIILQTKGESKRTYVYVSDAVTAILTVLVGDTYGNCYNVAAAGSFCSIFELAKNAAEMYSQGKIHVVIREGGAGQYPPTNYLNLSSDALKSLGWESRVALKDMISRIL